jgi:hypothetical protein
MEPQTKMYENRSTGPIGSAELIGSIIFLIRMVFLNSILKSAEEMVPGILVLSDPSVDMSGTDVACVLL